MPLKYVIEMVMDRIAASKVYKGKDYTNASPWEYYAKGKDYIVIHPETRALLEKLLLNGSGKGGREKPSPICAGCSGRERNINKRY